jgi:Leucine-rich repeat (LRR) protein
MSQLGQLRVTHLGLTHMMPSSDNDIIGLGRLLVDATSVNLSGTKITDKCCIALSVSKKLKHLSISETNITDIEFSSLLKIRTIDSLDACDTQITDAGLEFLGKSTVTSLWIQFCGISDKSVQLVGSAKGLHEISLIGTKVSASAIAKLRQMLPQTYVYGEEK